MHRIAVLISLIVALAVPAAADERFIVRVDDSAESPAALFERLGLRVRALRATRDGGAFGVVSSDVLPPEVVREMLESESSIHSVEPVRELRVPEAAEGGAKDDSLALARRQQAGEFLWDLVSRFAPYTESWKLEYYGQPSARSLELYRVHWQFGTGAGVVAIIDTGVDPNHPQLRNRLVPGYDFINDRPGIPSEWSDLDPETASSLEGSAALLEQSTVAVLDGAQPAVLNQSTVAVLDQKTAELLSDPRYRAFGHGTMVAGLVRLVAPRARIMPLKAFRADGTGDTATIAEAIYYAADNGADVINMSFSFRDFSTEVMRALNYATRRGVMAVAAAGNNGQETVVFPAALPNVTGVAATAPDGSRSILSNYGRDVVSISAPGEELVSSYPAGHYAIGFGTSFSAAIVSGTISLMKGFHEGVRPSELERALAMGREFSGEMGYGHLYIVGSLHWLSYELGGGE